jgi:pyruvate dehydrogenase E2 component (dihydrolipoamide acetyltransferase)
MATVVRMPSVLAGAAEAAIARWLVGVGDAVTVGAPVAEIETEKALVEYAAEESGIVGRLVLAEGQAGEVGDPILVLVSEAETDADIDMALGKAPTAGTQASRGAASGSERSFGRSGEPEAATVTTEGGGPGGPAATPRESRIFASPLVRKVAAEQGIDLAAVEGTGPNGRIVRRDLDRLAATPPRSPGPAPAPDRAAAGTAQPGVPVADGALPDGALPDGALPDGALPDGALPDGALVAGTGRESPAGGRLIPHTPMRRAIARRLSESKATVPHFYMATDCVVDELLALRGRVNATVPGKTVAGKTVAGETVAGKVSVNDFVVMAAAGAFADVPEANVTWSDEGLIAYGNVDISIAVATDGGLVTPVLRDVGAKRLSQVAREARDLAQRARDRRLAQREIEGGVLSVSNLGMYGTLEFSAIINPPQSAVLAVGAARPQPVAADGAVSVATVMRCTLSVDHRAIDGALAARWLAAFTARMQDPLGTIA